jgi:hypothetical protein
MDIWPQQCRLQSVLEPVIVVLDPDEMRRAAWEAVQRGIYNIEYRRKERFGCTPEMRWTAHVEGCGAEVALSKYTGIPWTPKVGDFLADDVGPYQIRNRVPNPRYPDDRMILHADDKGWKVYVHATGMMPTFRLWGWIYALDGQKQQYKARRRFGGDAYFVPLTALNPMSALPPP